MIIVTNTVLKKYEDRKCLTSEDVNKMKDAVPEFNRRSKVATILDVSFDSDEQVIHITFDYKGKSKTPGHALGLLTKLMSYQYNLHFYHLFDEKKCKEKYCKENRNKVNERSRQYNKKNRENINKHARERHKKNKEQINKQNRERYKKNRERIKERKKKYREKNKEYYRKYGKKNRERIRYNYYKREHPEFSFSLNEFIKAVKLCEQKVLRFGWQMRLLNNYSVSFEEFKEWLDKSD